MAGILLLAIIVLDASSTVASVTGQFLNSEIASAYFRFP